MATSAPSITSISKSGTNDDNVIFRAGQAEVDRLDMQHKVMHDANPELVYAPIDLSKGGCRILDQATGSGIWLRDLREAMSGQNTYVGTDIEDSYFPQDPPENISYHHQSMTQPWPKDWESSFDLVHSRMALPGIGTNPLLEVVKNLISLVKPGGWIELVEMEGNSPQNGPWGTLLATATKDLLSMVTGGQGVDLREKLIPIFKEAGLNNIEYKIFSMPYGARASETIRKISEASLLVTANGISTTTKMLPPISISRENLDAMPEKIMDEARKQGWAPVFFALWAQKPSSK